jgi:glycerophosphoryl diester phosphodiesterase
MGTVPNSMDAITTALSSNADIIEVDIRATRDGVVILTHDDAVRMPDGRLVRIEDLEWGSIGPSFAGDENEGVLRLETLFELAAHSDAILNLDSKESRAMVLSTKIIESYDRKQDVIFSGLFEKDIAIADASLRGFRYLFNADSLIPRGGGDEDGIADACAVAAAFHCSGINLEWTKASEKLIEYARRRCVPVMLWTVDKESDMAAALEFGPYSITTNRPDLLGSIIASRNPSQFF